MLINRVDVYMLQEKRDRREETKNFGRRDYESEYDLYQKTRRDDGNAYIPLYLPLSLIFLIPPSSN